MTEHGLEKCAPFITSQLQSAGLESHDPGAEPRRPGVTISRECGSGGRAIAQMLADYLTATQPATEPAWAVVDRNLVEQVLRDHHLPERIARFMPEDRVSEVADVIDELLGVRPSSWTLVQQTASTILRLANQGNVILVGRAANIVTAHLEHMVHVRFVGSLAKRTARIQQLYGLSRRGALRVIQHEDGGRKRYLRKHYGKDADDMLHYHLVINTDWISFDRATELIAQQVLAKVSSRLGANGSTALRHYSEVTVQVQGADHFAL